MNFIYITTNLINGKQYIGSHSGNKDDRYLGSGKLLKYSIKKYGREKFKREILEICNPSDNLILETKYIKEYNTISPNGYNILENGGHIIWDKELKERLSQNQKNKKLSEDHKRKIGKALKGKKRDPKIGKKISKTRKERGSYNFSKEHKEKISNTLKGRENGPHSKETKEKIRKGNIGNILSSETRKKMSLSKRGIKLSEDHKQNISYNNSKFWKEKKFSEEHKDKLRKSHIGKKQKRLICEYCKKDIAVNVYVRFHGQNCKNKDI
jgi:group I intron endonuclease